MFMMPRFALAVAVLATDHRKGVAMPDKVPILVLLGLDMGGRSHASRFAQTEAALVKYAAELMGYHVIAVAPDNPELYAIAERLPAGKIFATGRGFCPYIARPAFDKLAALVAGGITIEQRADAGAEPVFPHAAMYTTAALEAADALWAKIEVGSIVLVSQVGQPGWSESRVIGIKGDNLTLRWADDWSTEPFQAVRRAVALRHPEAD